MPDCPVRIAEEEIAKILPATDAVPVQGARTGDMPRVKVLTFAPKELSFAVLFLRGNGCWKINLLFISHHLSKIRFFA
jgi:hypothetical protein